jgi:hypothetical protein
MSETEQIKEALIDLYLSVKIRSNEEVTTLIYAAQHKII